MGKHINLMGYSLWISDDTQQESDEEISSSQPLYSPGVIAAYCIFTSLFVGIILYGINLSRRGYLWRGRVLIASSGSILAASLLPPILDSFSMTLSQSKFLLHGLVALSLYKAEERHFQRSIRNGNPQARWWLPLIWLGVGVIAVLLLEFLLEMFSY
jgi:hypothetical protein